MRNKIKNYEKFMKMAIEEAEISLREGNKGFGALLIKNGKILERVHDTEVITGDPTAHAEINLIRKVSKKFGPNLKNCSLISTHEPCPMCTTAAIWVKISEIIYGASIHKTMKLGRTRIPISSKEIIKKSPWKIEIKEGVLEKECLKLYTEEIRKWVKKLRKKIGKS